MGRIARGLALVVFAAAASIGCGLITGAGDLVADLPDDPGDDDAGGGGDDGSPVGPISCGAGTKRCADECVSAVDPAFGCAGASCDRCAVPFAASLTCDDQGRCAANSCFDGRADCNADPTDGCEADLTLPETCGSCKLRCNAGQFCAGAMGCVTSCPTGTSPCGMSCVNLTSSATHCGDCGKVCPSATNATPTCTASKCTIACNPGYGDCDMNPADGCEPLKAFFVDMDNDGHGAKGATATQACTAPAGHAPVADDCEDDNPLVFFGQTQYFPAPYVTAAGVKSFDYNCSGAEEPQGGGPVSPCPATCTPGYLKNGPTMTACGATQYVKCAFRAQCADVVNRPVLNCH